MESNENSEGLMRRCMCYAWLGEFIEDAAKCCSAGNAEGEAAGLKNAGDLMRVLLRTAPGGGVKHAC